MIIVTGGEMRALDAWTIDNGTPGRVLMQRAATGAVRVLRGLLVGRRGPVVFICGKGNNGGDGLVMARLLRRARRSVEVWLAADPDRMAGDAAAALRAWRRGGGRVAALRTAADLDRLGPRLRSAAVVVDALLGTGLREPVTGLLAAVIDAINSATAPVLAVDVASGLCADTGQVLGRAVRARATATFGHLKTGQAQFPGVTLSGEVTVVDIGIPSEAVQTVAPPGRLLEQREVAALVPSRPPDAHKGHFGHTLVVAGSRGKLGAGLLAAQGAARSGAGLTTLAVPDTLQPLVDGRVAALMTTSLPDDGAGMAAPMHEGAVRPWVEGRSAIVCGPGLGVSEGTRGLVMQLLRTFEGPVLLDADALNVIAGTTVLQDRRGRATVLTPHPGEMSRLTRQPTREIQADRVQAARALARATGSVVVLKGARTVVAGADGRYAVSPTGNPGLATGGSGDVLAGVVGGLLGQGLPAFEAASLGVYVHGAAADLAADARGEIGLAPEDVLHRLPPAFRMLRHEAGC